jgi:alpha-amylase
MSNGIMLQGFEWYCPSDGSFYRKMKENLDLLKKANITSVWLPPSTKGGSVEDVGYGVYDLFDLGEFDQKGTVRTKYGTKDELLELIHALKEAGISVISDVVMNHKAFADGVEVFKAVEVDPNDRTKEISEPHDIEGFTKFEFKGRNGQYSDFVWNFHHFSGVDYDQKEGRKGIFRIIGDNKGWNLGVSNELGNYDYLMFANIDHAHTDVKKHLTQWACWFIEETGVNGFRLDALKHIDHQFLKEWVKHILKAYPDFFFVGEYWDETLDHKSEYLAATDYHMSLFDVKLHNQFYQASVQKESFDLRTLFNNSLLRSYPQHTVTFVDNHDSQPHQSLESWVEFWFKPHAYASILLQKEGYPCVFYGDLFGVGGPSEQQGHYDMIQMLSDIRLHHAYGDQMDIYQSEHTIGWIRQGDQDHPQKLVVVLNNHESDELFIQFDTQYMPKCFKQIFGDKDHLIEVNEDGTAYFAVSGKSIAIYLET